MAVNSQPSPPESAGRMATHSRWLRIIINLAVVAYLLISKRLFGLRGGGAAERAERQADTGWQALERADPYLAIEAGDT